MKNTLRTLLPALPWIALAADPAGVATNADVRSMMDVWDRTAPGLHNYFALTGTVHRILASVRTASAVPCFVLDDGELLVSVFSEADLPGGLRPGDRIVASGVFGLQKHDYGNEPYATVREIRVLGPGPEVRPAPRTLQDLSGVRDDLRLVRTAGTVIDWRTSEEDPDYLCLTLKDGPTTMPVFVPSRDPDAADRLLESRVAVVGTFHRALQSVRRYARPLIVSRLENVEVLSPPPPPDSVPALERKIYLTPKDILTLGKRKVDGEIVAVWQGNNLLLREDDGRIVRVKLSHRNRTAPRAGLRATICGYPETDQFNIILGTATISSAGPGTPAPQHPVRLASLADVIGRNPSGTATFETSFYGKPVTLEGTVRNLPPPGDAGGRIGLDCDGHPVQLDTSACPEATEGLELGCRIEATGVCLLETNDYDAQTDMPHISGLTLVLRGRGDIAVVSRPPWLTPGRFLVILSAMAGVLALFLVWNASLRVLVERRGRELARKQVEAAHAKLKTIERTRLATELHDSVVQNLTGAALEIRAAQAALPRADGDPGPHLDIALKTIDSSRAELRNCIWDLRSRALEENDAGEAVRITLQPHLAGARLDVRFDVPRRRIPDNDFHNILCIVRELVVNAVRHGRATALKVDGALDGGRLRLSVEDDGCGFDPAARPGMEQGHFGLEGVMERVKALDGTADIASAPGAGTRVSIDIPLPEETET
ncbi:MAG: sensor histidine kinase [Kiritimatiellae bacterium]|nr:sensor histidine kinase [Kiritimatiellia bacterium]